jgi:hypothetical protein
MQHQPFPLSAQPKPIAIAVDGEPLGVVIPGKDGFRFLAVRFSAFPLDGQTFESVKAAEFALGEATRNAPSKPSPIA